jgi:hypothetical protein
MQPVHNLMVAVAGFGMLASDWLESSNSSARINNRGDTNENFFVAQVARGHLDIWFCPGGPCAGTG